MKNTYFRGDLSLQVRSSSFRLRGKDGEVVLFDFPYGKPITKKVAEQLLLLIECIVKYGKKKQALSEVREALGIQDNIQENEDEH